MNQTNFTPKVARPKYRMIVVKSLANLESFDLSIHNPKYINHLSLFSDSNFVKKTIKRMKLLRKIEVVGLNQKGSQIDQILLRHSKTLTQITIPSYISLNRKISKYQISLDDHKISLYKSPTSKNIFSKLRIKELQIDLLRQIYLDYWKVNKIFFSKVTRHIARLRGLESIKILLNDQMDEDSYRFLSLLDQALSKLPETVTIHLQIMLGTRVLAGSPFYFNFVDIAKRIKSISVTSTDFFPLFTCDQIGNLKQVQTIKASIGISEESSFKQMQKLSSLINLAILQADLRFGYNHDDRKLLDFIEYFSLPESLKSLELSLLDISHLPHENITTSLQNFIKRVQKPKSLEDLILKFDFRSCEHNINFLYGILLRTIKNMNKLRTLHLKVSNDNMDSSNVPLFYFSRFISRYGDILSDLQELHFELPKISFEEFKSDTKGNREISWNKVLISGDITCLDCLDDFLGQLKPSEYADSTLTLNISNSLSSDELGNLFEIFYGEINVETISLKVKTQNVNKEHMFDKLLIMLEDLTGPRQLFLEIPNIYLKYDDHELIIETLEKSSRSLDKFEINFSLNPQQETSHLCFELVGENYELVDYNFVSEINSYSSMSSFADSEGGSLEMDEA